MFECVARPRYIPGHGWVTLENADTPDLGAEVQLAQARAREHALALAQLQKSAGTDSSTTEKELTPDGSDRSRRDRELPGGDRRRAGDFPGGRRVVLPAAL